MKIKMLDEVIRKKMFETYQPIADIGKQQIFA